MIRVMVVACVAACALAPAARAQDTTAPAPSAAQQRCDAFGITPDGTVNTRDVVAAGPAVAPPAAWPAGPAQLPAAVDLRTQTETFNRNYEFVTSGGSLYARIRSTRDAWRAVPLPDCLAGRVGGIAVDDDELIALDRGRRIFVMDHALKDPARWNWSTRWGPLLWSGPGYTLPPTRAWSWSVLSPAEDQNWTDPAGNKVPVGADKVSHIWGIRTNPNRFTFWDPWLPHDESYEMCGPHRGTFKAVNLSASGSHVFIVGARGDMFTRMYDFDISGHDPLFFDYAYTDQRGRGDGEPIQLPAEPWTQQPKIPGTITDAISIHKTGLHAVHAMLRVEGERRGRTGYWERDLAAPARRPWKFVATGRPLRGKKLDNPRRDTSRLNPARSENARYVMRKGSITAELANFNVYCSPARLKIREKGRTRTVILHHVDGLRQKPIHRGLADRPREQYGVIETGRNRFEKINVLATRDEVTIVERQWTFKRVARR
jgi:hypothetical protein